MVVGAKLRPFSLNLGRFGKCRPIEKQKLTDQSDHEAATVQRSIIMRLESEAYIIIVVSL